jgi:tRNA1Val (adenine37-N6)-methyltransferase
MSNSYFQFKSFRIAQDRCAMKVTTDACLFGAIAAANIQQGPNARRMLDIGAGTGLLSLMVAQKHPCLVLDAIEIQAADARQAVENIQGSPWKERISVLHADVRAFTPAAKYDVIICNPPFYENEIASAIQGKNIAHHNAGLDLQSLLSLIPRLLSEKGEFWLLLPYKRFNEVQNLITNSGLQKDRIITLKQSVKHSLFRFIIQGTHKKEKQVYVSPEEISVCDDAGKYTEQFSSLLSDYYLGS